MVKLGQINAELTDLLELQIRLTAVTARILDKAEVISLDGFAGELRLSADGLPDGPVRQVLESLAAGIGPESPPQFEVIEGGKE